MTETIIDSIIRILAFITVLNKGKESTSTISSVNSYLRENYDSETSEKYYSLYNKYVEKYRKQLDGKKDKIDYTNNSVILGLCNEISGNHGLFDRIVIIIQLLEFYKKEKALLGKGFQFVDFIAANFKIDQSVYTDIKHLTFNQIEKLQNKSHLCIIDGNEKSGYDNEIKHVYNVNQIITIQVYKIEGTSRLIFNYFGPRNLYLNGHKIQQNRVYVFAPGSMLKTSRIRPIYHSKILLEFTDFHSQPKITFCAKDIEYKFNRNDYGVHKFNFCEESGRLVGIMGGSGTGKSTLLNVLNGSLDLTNGKITINGYDLDIDKEKLKGLIGYVPQDDMLIEELTVFENIYYNAKFCFDNVPEEEILKRIDKTLDDFDLLDVRDLKVGNPLKKVLSGGQRKRLNIALEMIREPSVLFVDEPTSGLSSMDSEKLMNLLKRQTFKGKLVFSVIHQPSSDLYKLFDRIIILDKGGYVVYNGNPLDAITYFKNRANFINADESECLSCGNIKTGQPLRIIDSRKVNLYGKFLRERRVSPEEWYKLYRQKYDDSFETGMHKFSVKKKRLPLNNFQIPGFFKQFKIYGIRDLISKVANRQYLIITLLEAPLLALILSVFTRYNAGTTENPGLYIFSENVNIPVYLFMSIIVALFLGLIQSAEEIFKDRKLLKRESFLNLSRFSYLSSKIAILFTFSAIQMFIYVLIGNAILHRKGMLLHYWIILFSTACFANLLGLNLSTGLNTAVSIYILIPLLLIPQILFSGFVVDFKKMPRTEKNRIYTPVIGDLMASRWAYEALAVHQYKNNKYNKEIFQTEFERQQYIYKAKYLIPELKRKVHFIENESSKEKTDNYILIRNEINNLIDGVKVLNDSSEFNNLDVSRIHIHDNVLPDSLRVIINELSIEYKKGLDHAEANRIRIIDELTNRMSSAGLLDMKKKFHNKQLAKYVEDPFELVKMVEFRNTLIRNDKPVYKVTPHKLGRAHFYAPYKKVGNNHIPTFVYNLFILWIFSIILFVFLYHDLIRIVVDKIEMKKKK